MNDSAGGSAPAYCRQIEAYLCRKNDGHLIRIVGPAFERVCGWSARGVPLKVAFHGIDRCCERYYAKGPRRRPVRVEFCEADVLDAFDEWRRAVGVSALEAQHAGLDGSPPTVPAEAEQSTSPLDDPGGIRQRRHDSLPAHLDRVVARLTAVRAADHRALDPVIDAVMQELERARSAPRGLRGGARQALIDRLRGLDAALVDAARAQCDDGVLQQLVSDADAELAPFRRRMSGEAYDRSRAACVDRLIRERLRLPIVAFDG